MKRFSKSGALVPILIVIVLAFFAQRIISPSTEEPSPTYSEFIAQINDDAQAAEIESVTIKTNDNTIEVTRADDTTYETGYPDNTEQQLVATLESQDISTKVEGNGGGGFLSVLTYILPFI